MSKWFVALNPVKIIVVIAFIISLYKLDKKKYVDRKIFLIILLAIINDVVSSVLYINTVSIGLTNTIYTIVHTFLWLKLLGFIFQNKHNTYLTTGFIILSLINLFFYEGLSKFNYTTFILGSILYLSVFLWESYKKIAQEQLNFFTSKPYLFLVSPIFNFIGLSLVFAFKTKAFSLVLFKNITLFMAISYFVNYLYYGLLIYIMLKKQK